MGLNGRVKRVERVLIKSMLEKPYSSTDLRYIKHPEKQLDANQNLPVISGSIYTQGHRLLW
jgi:hypothetical protein